MEDTHAHANKRLDQFVDAAFGFAVTLLLIAGAQAPETLDDLRTALLNLPASLGAFALIAMFWNSHRAFSRVARRHDTTTLLLTLAIVFTVLVYVFPLRLLTQSTFAWLSGGYLPGRSLIDSWGDLAALYQIYGLGFAVLSGLYAALFAYGRRRAVAPEDIEECVSSRDAWTICAVSGVVSALAAFMPLRYAPWLPPTLYWLIPLGIWARSVQRRRKAVKASAPAAEAAEAG